MTDLMGKITGGRNILETIASKIPGFSGYMERETRRTADKLLRDTIVQRYEEQWGRVSELQRQLIAEGQIDLIDNLEAAAIKLRTFIDQVRTASYGYSGFFDAVKVNEDELAKLYTFDNALLDGVTRVGSAIDNVAASIGSDGLPAAIRNLTAIGQELNDTFAKRKEVLTA